MNKRPTDPIEAIIFDALTARGVEFQQSVTAPNGANIDFFLPHENIFIECKAYSSERTARQLEDLDNVILIQGKDAAKWFGMFITGATS